MSLRSMAVEAYLRWLRSQVSRGPIPQHVAIVMDGNRRWARGQGFANVSVGHRYGAEHLETVLDWCAALGIRQLSVYVASADNLAKRSPGEVAVLMEVAEHVIARRLARPDGRWQIHVAGRLGLVPDSTRHALKLAEEATRNRAIDGHLTLAIGYGGRAEVVDAVRSALEEAALRGMTPAALAETFTVEDIAAHLYTSGQPYPDLVIRTSGEQRLSDFLLWQTANSQLHFCDVYWPGFRQVDFLRAVRSYADRSRP